ncbi:MAG: response regulator [Thermomicrobium sp.]|nr:response regulator [Thermomicrobium sp.]
MYQLPLVVIVEPEWPTRSYLRAELRELGYEVLAFETAEEAERSLEHWGFQPSLLVLDLSRSGSEATGVAQLLARFPDTPLLVIASPLRALPQHVQRRVTRLLRRPASVHELVQAIRELVPPPFIVR